MYVDQCILEATVKQYETISDIIVHHVNTNQMNEFKEILDLPTEEGSSQTLRDVLSTYEREMQVNDAVV